jgi:hypothetical protein
MPGGYVVRDADGQALAYLYSRENDAEARQAKVLTKDDARCIAINRIAPRGETPRGMPVIVRPGLGLKPNAADTVAIALNWEKRNVDAFGGKL